MGLNTSPSILLSYIEAILDFLETRKHCEAIMDNLLLFTPTKKVHMAKLEDLLKALLLKLEPPKMLKGCRSFAGMVNFLNMFSPELKKLLKPIYNLTRKGRPLIWGKE